MRVIGYLQDSTADGEGLRDVLFLSGCSHNCTFCHNKDSWNSNNGLIFTQQMEDKVIKEAKRLNPPAITLSGGDPLYKDNYLDVLEFCKKLKSNNVNVWLYTGYTLEEVKANFKDILLYIDVLVDGKYIEEEKNVSLPFRGSNNQKIYKLT